MTITVKATVLILLFVGVVFCWGPDGHQIVGQVASQFLTSTTTSAVNKMLNGQSLASISTWPDNYDHTSQGSWSEHLHYVNLANNATLFDYSACQATSSDPAGCVVTAITNSTARLMENLQNNYWETCKESSDSDVPCDLSFLVHWHGDVHQPLHVAYDSDEGGNKYDVDFNGNCESLHSLWDSGLISYYESETKQSWSDIAKDLVNWINNNQNISDLWIQNMIPAAWANETFWLARNVCYNFSPGDVPANNNWALGYITASLTRSSCSGPTIGNSYYQRTMPEVLTQLAKGGFRLATHLNLMYDPSFNVTTSAVY